jgi:hypothetical protein
VPELHQRKTAVEDIMVNDIIENAETIVTIMFQSIANITYLRMGVIQPLCTGTTTMMATDMDVDITESDTMNDTKGTEDIIRGITEGTVSR